LVIGYWVLVHPTAFSQGLTGLKICIDPGHGGNNPANDRRVEPDAGNVFWESESNFQKALLLKPLLEARGATVLLTRNTNTYPDDGLEPSLSARVAFANSNNVDWFHSIHSNATGGTNTGTNYSLILVREKRSLTDPAASTGNGLGIPEQADSWTMAQILGPKIRSFIRTTSVQGPFLDWTFYGGTSGGFSLGVLRGLLMPGELSEGSFHDYYPETRRLLNQSYREMEAYALLQSFQSFFGAPADGVGLVAGILTDYDAAKPINHVVVRLLPEGRLYMGDAYNNGFFAFDSVSPGSHWIRFETSGYPPDSMQVSVAAGGITFADRLFYGMTPATVTYSSPRQGDSAFAVNASMGVIFSHPMDTASVRAAFTLTPSFTGTFSWTNANKTLIFRPTVPLPYSTTFVLRVETTAVTPAGIPLDAKGLGYPNAHVVEFRTAPAPTSVEPEDPSRPFTSSLRQNFPNPFNPRTHIVVQASARGHVTLIIFNTIGQEVARLVDGMVEAGTFGVEWDAGEKPSGVYLAVLQSDDTRSVVRMLLLK
jgi:N-acetylmuramoyl-L-alanine amidase